jgi:hypothetical protein
MNDRLSLTLFFLFMNTQFFCVPFFRSNDSFSLIGVRGASNRNPIKRKKII